MTIQSPFAVSDHYVNGLRLLRIVRLRREFRTLGLAAVAGLPLWFGLVVGIQALTPDGSSLWNLADDAAGPGFIVLGCLVVICVVGLVVLRYATGWAGRVAAAFLPALRRGAEATVDGDADAMTGLLHRLRKKPPLSLAQLLWFCLFAAIAVFTALDVAPAYQANHGHGGTQVTIGQDARISRVEVGSRGHRDYFLSTPVGEAIAEDSKPQDGQHWTVVDNSFGNDEAYLIGGHDYLLVGFLALGALVAELCVIGSMVASYRRELRIRRANGHAPLAYSVRRLAAGARPVVSFGMGKSMPIGLPPLATDSDDAARALVNRRRRNSTIVTVVVVAVVVTGGVLIDRSIKPTERDITLSYLGGPFWSDAVYVNYVDDDNAVRNVTADMLNAGGVSGTPAVGATWMAIVSANQDDPTTDVDDADITVSDIGSASPRQAVAGGVAFEREVAGDQPGTQAAAAVSGLPPGWAGVVTSADAQDKDRTVYAFGSAGGSLVDIEVDGQAGDAYLTARTDELVSAIARRGIPGFVSDTAP